MQLFQNYYITEISFISKNESLSRLSNHYFIQSSVLKIAKQLWNGILKVKWAMVVKISKGVWLQSK